MCSAYIAGVSLVSGLPLSSSCKFSASETEYISYYQHQLWATNGIFYTYMTFGGKKLTWCIMFLGLWEDSILKHSFKFVFCCLYCNSFMSWIIRIQIVEPCAWPFSMEDNLLSQKGMIELYTLIVFPNAYEQVPSLLLFSTKRQNSVA